MGKSEFNSRYQGLFNLMSEEFGLTLLESDMQQIINEVRKIDSHSPDPVNTLHTISDVNDPANDNSQLIEFEHLNTLQEGDWFHGTEEQYRDIVFMSGQFKESFVSSFIEDCMIYGMVYSTELGNGQLENLTSLRRHKLTPEEFIRRAENTFKTK